MSKVSQKVLKVLGIFGSVQAIGILCSVVRAKLIAIWIGPLGVGLFGIFNAVIDMLSSATQLNIRQSAVRDISESGASATPRIAGAVRWWARVLGVLGAVVMLAASPLLSIASFDSYDLWWAFAWLSVVMFCMSIASGEQALMQGAGQLKRLAKSTMWGAVGGTALSVPMYYFLGVGSIVPSLIVFGLSSMTASLLSQKVKSIKLPWRECVGIGRSFLKLGIYLTVSSVAATAASFALKSYISIEASVETVGLYQTGYTLIVSYVGVIFTAIGMEYYPRLVGVAQRSKMASKVVSHEMSLVLCVLCPVCVLFVVADRLIVQILYSEEFLAVLPMIQIGICGALFRAISYCMSFVMVARADGKCYVAVELTSAVIGLALNIVFFKLWGIPGVGFSYVVWYAVYAIIVWFVYRFRYSMQISGLTIIIALISLLTVVAAIMLRTHSWQAALLMMLPAFGVCVVGKRGKLRKA